ncbi:MAG TPA: ATP-binding protein [Sphingomicrobium sp.]|nr:ATP-binding protein [Sphingomicrobium sp.]
MASAPGDQGPVTGRIDSSGRLTSADAALLRLQEEAGSSLGAQLALPQLAAIARSSRKLGVPLSRSIIAASSDQDLDLWVRAEPDGDGVLLTIEGWISRPAAAPRLALVATDPVNEGDADAGPDYCFTTDAELRIRLMADGLAERLGIDAAEAVGEPLTRHFLLADDGDGGMPLLTALVGRRDFRGQVARLRGDEQAGPVVLHGHALTDPLDQFAGYEVWVSFGEQAPDNQASLFDHALDEALRSPLDRIIAAADRIVERSEGPLRSDYAAYAGDIAAAGRHLLSVIRAMTAQEAAEGGRVDLSRAAIDAVQLVQAKAADKAINIELIGADSPLQGRGEPRGVVQILVNLLGNAVRHSPDQASIAVIVEQQGEQVTVTVADEGPGIAETDQQRVFERYERVGDTPGGIGLGLAISRRLARSMGGDIRLVSALGEGSRFTLVLPTA